MAAISDKPKAHTHEDGISIKGWTIGIRKAPIIGDKVLEEYSRKLGNVLTLPEILFGNNELFLKHDVSGTTLSFKAFDALLGWKAEDLPPLKVSVAAQWQASRMNEIETQQAVLLEYDWTYTTPYQGTLTSSSALEQPQQCFAMGSTAALQSFNPKEAPPPAPHFTADTPPPITSTTTANTGPAPAAAAAAAAGSTSPPPQVAGSTPPAAAPAAAVPAAGATPPPRAAQGSPPLSASPAATAPAAAEGTRAPAAAAAAVPGLLPSWQTTQQQIDRRMLMVQEEPILFYAEVPLYESELDDNGCVQLGVKIRVMPRCWLVLLRFWLRVDGTLVRLRETRLFCRFDAPHRIVRETKHSEGTMEALRAAGAPCSSSSSSGGNAYKDADAAAGVFSAIAPACVTLFQLEELNLPGGGGAGAADAPGPAAAAPDAAVAPSPAAATGPS